MTWCVIYNIYPQIVNTYLYQLPDSGQFTAAKLTAHIYPLYCGSGTCVCDGDSMAVGRQRNRRLLYRLHSPALALLLLAARIVCCAVTARAMEDHSGYASGESGNTSGSGSSGSADTNTNSMFFFFFFYHDYCVTVGLFLEVSGLVRGRVPVFSTAG